MLNRVASVASRSMLLAATAVLVLSTAVPTFAAGESGPGAARVPGWQIPLIAGRTSDRYKPIPAPTRSFAPGSVDRALKATSTITVSYHGFSGSKGEKAKAAFQAAVNVWQSIVVSSQTIKVDATWEPLDPNVLGSAGPNSLFAENDDLMYPSALHEARCRCNDELGPEILASFNSNFSAWYLGTDGKTPTNRWDFETVVLHELGHGLGFLSSFVQTQNGSIFWGFGAPRKPMRFDTNEWSAQTAGTNIVNGFTNGSAGLRTQVTDGSVFLGGSHLEAVLGGRGKLFAPSPWQQGSSNSHFDENKFAPGTVNALMTPVLNNGESIHDPGPATVAVFQDIGWSVAGSSDDTTPPTVDAPDISFVSPQTVGSSAQLNVAWPDATDDSGIASYELQRQEGAGAWTPVSLPSPTSTFADVAVTRGSNYGFRVRATDGAGNTGPWTTTPSAHVTTVQETAGGIAYSAGWSLASLTGALGGKVEQSSTTDATATFTFTGSAVAFVTDKTPARGIVEITLDSDSPVTVDLRAGSKQTKRVVWASDPGLASGMHTVTIRVTGTTSGTSDRIDVDAFLTWP